MTHDEREATDALKPLLIEAYDRANPLDTWCPLCEMPSGVDCISTTARDGAGTHIPRQPHHVRVRESRVLAIGTALVRASAERDCAERASVNDVELRCSLTVSSPHARGHCAVAGGRMYYWHSRPHDGATVIDIEILPSVPEPSPRPGRRRKEV